jgi:hypothetical protein
VVHWIGASIEARSAAAKAMRQTSVPGFRPTQEHDEGPRLRQRAPQGAARPPRASLRSRAAIFCLASTTTPRSGTPSRHVDTSRPGDPAERRLAGASPDRLTHRLPKASASDLRASAPVQEHVGDAWRALLVQARPHVDLVAGRAPLASPSDRRSRAGREA